MNSWRNGMVLVIVGLLSGCLSWETTELTRPDVTAGGFPLDSVDPYGALRAQTALITSAVQLDESIEEHLRFLKRDPTNTEALVALASQMLLRGTAYTQGRAAKRTQFRQAMHYSEQAMLTDPAYAARVEAGDSPWEACDTLGASHMDAMLFWVTSVLYMFREGMVFPQPIIHVKWIRRAGEMLDHMETVERTWNGGAVLFSQAIVHHVVPPVAGGDPAKAQQYLKEAVASSDGWMLSRWGRAKYFLNPETESTTYREDLESVLAGDPNALREAPCWRRYFQAEARSMLARTH